MALGMAGEARAQGTGALECGAFYRIERGDTLRAITVRTYGHDRFAFLFRANRDILSDPAFIEVGQLLFLPCPQRGPADRTAALRAEGRVPTAEDQRGSRLTGRAPAPASGTDPTPTEGGAPSGRGDIQAATVTVARPEAAEVRGTAAEAAGDGALPRESILLTSNGFAPVSGRALPDGGLAAVLIRAALLALDPGHAVRPVFVNDRPAHLESLLPMGMFHLGSPWPAPACPASPGARVSERLCRDFLFSRPIFEIDVAVVTRADGPLAGAVRLADAAGRVICRPSDMPPVDLEASGVRLAIVEAEDPATCFGLLGQGAVDLVSLPAAQLPRGGPAAGLVAVAALASRVPVHAIAWRDAPGAAAQIARLDRGLAQLQASGQWFTLVSDYLATFNASRVAAQ